MKIRDLLTSPNLEYEVGYSDPPDAFKPSTNDSANKLSLKIAKLEKYILPKELIVDFLSEEYKTHSEDLRVIFSTSKNRGITFKNDITYPINIRLPLIKDFIPDIIKKQIGNLVTTAFMKNHYVTIFHKKVLDDAAWNKGINTDNPSIITYQMLPPAFVEEMKEYTDKKLHSPKTAENFRLRLQKLIDAALDETLSAIYTRSAEPITNPPKRHLEENIETIQEPPLKKPKSLLITCGVFKPKLVTAAPTLIRNEINLERPTGPGTKK